MGFLTIIDTGQVVPLSTECLLGRSEGCALRFERADISNEHACVRWSGATWELRDLGSRNGTYLDGARLAPGQCSTLPRGSTVGLGRAEAVLRLADDRPPQLAALDLSSGVWLSADGAVLALPDDAAPELSVLYLREVGWLSQSAEGTQRVQNGDTLMLGSRRFRLHLPGEVPPTLDAERPPNACSALPRLSFRVSRDEEYIELDLVAPSPIRALGARAHHYVLLSLARLRARDAQQANLALSEHGWVHVDELGKMLRLDRNHLYVSIHRARRQLSALGLDHAAAVVEARPGTGMVRFGYPDFAIKSL